uniref:Soluble scavenger receptor cysteine-rich domain-containing protein SSC5D n=1 Tax=Salarias fasciatus TaxID=181472 RepID=A0A672HDF7_SALFA
GDLPLWTVGDIPPHLFSFLFLSAASPVRLANSGNRCSGRVEMFHAGQWGTVCDDHWDLDNANVVCRQLDCGRAQSALSNAAFGPGRGPIWLDDVFCSGNESSISDCRHSGFGVHNCGHYEDASGEVRLANGGNSSCSGRVEIFHFGQWGTVCDDLWDLLDAEVVCRQLGCGRVLSAPTQARFGQGSGPIWYDNVVCTGSETKLSECRHQGIGSHNCGHQEDAGVVCEGVEGEVRLVNGGNNCLGRVEIFHDGQWGTMCDDLLSLDIANVVCRQLDCGRGRMILSRAAFGAGEGPIWYDDLFCIGNESSISDCRHSGLGVHNCNHNEDISVVCEEVRLIGGSSFCSGRVEIFHFGQWGTVCDDSWDLLDAEVVCRQLGCGRVLSAPTWAHFGQGSGPIWYDNVMCTGSETKLSECRHQGIGSHNCAPTHLSSFLFLSAASPVRLANSRDRCSGRVEIFHAGQWGTVCDDHWDLDNANVVCRQLDCGRAQSALSNAAFGGGAGPIWLDDVSCSGSESSISDCRHSGFGVHNCGHYEDASVICERKRIFILRRNSSCSGRVEIFHAGQWGTVCDDHWDLDNANVVCRQLDCGTAQSALSNAAFGAGSGPIWLDDVYCSGNENSGFGVHNCGHHEDASVICEQVRLANGGSSSCSGRVEIFHFGQWGTVCDDLWDLLDAEVVCRQLGCGRVLSAPTQARFGQGSGPIWYDNVMFCDTTECFLAPTHLSSFLFLSAASPVRLADSENRCSGRVEIFHAGQWGTVCDDHWDLDNANVVCRQLDCGTAQSALSNAAFGAGRGPIWLDNVYCYGNEPSISDCRHSGFGVHNCVHHEDASVVCEGTVCDDSWDLLDAEVVCRQLGCGRVLSAPTQARFGQGSGPIWYDNVACTAGLL